jgi:transposase-like protein
MSIATLKPNQRRHYSPALKRQLVDQCIPGIAISSVAQAHGINANLLRRWIHQQSGSVANLPVSLVPVQIDAPTAIEPNDAIHLDIQRGAVRVSIRWPMTAAKACAHLLGNWLK